MYIKKIVKNGRTYRALYQGDKCLRYIGKDEAFEVYQRDVGIGKAAAEVLATRPHLAPKASLAIIAAAKREAVAKLTVSRSDSWATPPKLYADLDAEFHFDDDPCPLNDHPLEDGLSRPWGRRVFLNPPYSRPEPWVRKAYYHALDGNLVVGLLRGDTSTGWFHDWVLDKAEVRFIRGRLSFSNRGRAGRAPFPSIIVVWGSKGG